ncbi:hypothetical protein N6H18_10745 [Reichenbachiella agarivorans]|uniref:Uncharacterized protein n=1 Tax=Reichenbachiella agarivorans TaxID=2979464 RepID=A0ABY6CJX7_9BACT|nr:hypothetical protein [Reichenbachiella agarivorans]UXP30830.1 hypothetical protein N6H18_10745 [Reichenbachiella agarivorans]
MSEDKEKNERESKQGKSSDDDTLSSKGEDLFHNVVRFKRVEKGANHFPDPIGDFNFEYLRRAAEVKLRPVRAKKGGDNEQPEENKDKD